MIRVTPKAAHDISLAVIEQVNRVVVLEGLVCEPMAAICNLKLDGGDAWEILVRRKVKAATSCGLESGGERPT